MVEGEVSVGWRELGGGRVREEVGAWSASEGCVTEGSCTSRRVSSSMGESEGAKATRFELGPG